MRGSDKVIKSEKPHKWVLSKLPVCVTTLFDRPSGLNALSFGHGASVIWIKVDFHGLASVSFIYSDTTGFQSADYCQGC